MARRAVALLSGGLDSTVAAAEAWSLGFEVHGLTVDYGQRHAREVDAARVVAHALRMPTHRVIAVDLAAFGGSALTDRKIAVPKGRSHETMATNIPATYVPARNTVLLSLALAMAEPLGAHDIFLGVNAVDYSGYPDCRPEFLEAFERTARLGTKAGTAEGAEFRIHAPLLRMTKSEIVQRGVQLGVDLGLTHSCYDPDGEGRACGACDACRIRRRGFEEAGVPDPTVYAP